MYKHSIFTLLSVLCFFGCKPTEQTSSKTTDPVIATIGGTPVYSSEFAYVYKKNNSNAENAYSTQSVNEYLDLYTNFRLKVKEAEQLGLDTADSFNKELEGYKKQLAQPYLTEKTVTEQLSKEAYERMKEEVSASHILINVGPDADPKDTLAAYEKITAIKDRAIKGESFEKLAQELSEDPSAKTNKGNLGYFSSLQMVYPFENAAYNTPKGEISKPVRTRFGYHILKVNDRRPSQGQLQVAHIMIRTTPGMPAGDSVAAQKKIEEIYSRIQKNEDWKTLTEQFSEDGNSKNKGGELPWFSTGKMIPSFEEAAFALSKPGDISKPVQTPYGWHIIKLIEKKPLEPYSELESTIKSKVSKDTRSELNKTVLIQRLKKENGFTENSQALNLAVSMADSTLFSNTWDKKVDNSKNSTLFTIDKKNYTVNDFLSYVANTSKKNIGQSKTSPAQYMRGMYKSYTDEELMKYEESNLENKHYDYKMLVKEYRDGILLFQLMDEKVWSKAIQDTAGLKEFFNSNREKYKWDSRAHAAIYSVADEATLNKVKAELKKGVYPVKNNAPLGNSYFEAGKTILDEKAKSATEIAASRMRKDKNYFLEITGFADSKEAAAKGGSSLSLERAKSVKNHLIAKGIDSTLLRVTDGGKVKSKSSEKDRAENRKVSFTLFSKSAKTLEGSFNENAPLTLQVTEGAFQKGENALLDSLTWKTGEQTFQKNGRIYHVVISKIEEPRLKSYEEARGLAISEYQNYLEQKWISGLKEKYPVTVKREEVEKLIKQ